MTVEEAVEILHLLLQTNTVEKSLIDVQELVFSQCWEGKTYTQIAASSAYDAEYIKQVGAGLWKVLGQALGERVHKNNIRSALRRYKQKAIAERKNIDPKFPSPIDSQIQQDLHEAVDVSVFYGRTDDLSLLSQWVVDENCRLIALLGLGGIGKTALSVKFTEELKEQFDITIWRSLRNAPPVGEFLDTLLNFMAGDQSRDLPKSISQKIFELIKYLKAHRCLIVLDSFESVLQSGNYVGKYHEGYLGYGELIRRIAEIGHQSCVLITSREKPEEVAIAEGDALPVRSLQISGLQVKEGQEILKIKGLFTSDAESEQLVTSYRGNPLALRIIATSIRDLFGRNITDFFTHRTFAFNSISNLISEHFARLTSLEHQVMYWLAINREPVDLAELQTDIVPTVSLPSLLSALESLYWRSLIERTNTGFTQQPVIMEYVTENLINQICQEIVDIQPINMLQRYALIKAQASSYVREAQIRSILEPISQRLCSHFRCPQGLADILVELLAKLRQDFSDTSGYGGGNIINLLHQIQADLTGYDFSYLPIWQAYLPEATLRHTNFSHTDLSRSVFSTKIPENLHSSTIYKMYEGMNITNVTGLPIEQKDILKTLGAIEIVNSEQ